MQKTTAMVIALAKLHNFCIDRKETVVPCTVLDQVNIESQDGGHIALVQREQAGNQFIPEQLLGAGHHFQDVGRRDRQRFDAAALPRNILAAEIEAAGLTRPVVVMRRH